MHRASSVNAASTRYQRGVSLIELGVVIAIIGIIAAFIIPSFMEQSAKGRRTDGQSLLLKASQRMKTYYTENNTFTTDVADIGYASNISPEGYYTLSVVTPTVACPIGSCFVLQAAPRGDQIGDRCGNLTVGSSGANGAGANNCW